MIARRSLLAGAFASPLLAAPAKQAQPNLVLFLSDDHGYFDSPVYGARDVRTPAMEQLARDGMAFDAMFAGSPTCVPSRAVIMSGLLPARNGALPNHSGLAPGVRTLPAYLAALGYEVVHFGKGHFQPAANYSGWTNVPSETKRGPLTSDLETGAVERWLSERAGALARNPVCMVVCSHSPHVYWRENKTYDPRTISLPPTFVDTPETRSERAKYYSDVSFADQQLGEVYEACRSHLSSNTLFIYTSDNGPQWPFAKWSLYDAGIRLPFLAAWPGTIRPGSRSGALISFADILPTFIELAGGKPPAGIDGKSFARVLTGRSRRHREEIYAAHSGDRDFNVYPMRCVRTSRFKYIRNLHPEFKYTTHIDVAGPDDGRIYFDSWVARAKVNASAAAVVQRYHARPSEELYDVVADPHEMENLAGSAKYLDILSDLRGRLSSWMKSQRDEGQVFGRPTLLERSAR